jgi:uncharacterized protein
MSDGRVQRLIAEACLVGLGAENLEVRGARFGISRGDLAALAATPERLGLYRRLVRTNLLNVAGRMMPRTRARLNDVAEGAFDTSFDAFLAERAPATHYLRDVPAEFLEWVALRWAADPALPSYATDLARQELVHFQIASAPPLATPPALAELAIDRRLVFAPARRKVRYGHAVHFLPDDIDDRTAPEKREVSLLIYRDAENITRTLELSPLAAQIADRLLGGETLGDALSKACAEEKIPLTPEILASTAHMLADWGERGLLLGAALELD